MIAVDSNVLVRLVVDDDKAQVALAREAIERAVADGDPILVALPVICELVWVLERSYGFERPAVADVIAGLLTSADLEIEARALVRAALARFRTGRADFTDYLIGQTAEARGAEATLTFDRALREEAGFRVLG